MQPDDHVCLCFKVSQRKLVNYMNRTSPEVASQLADCLGAGTGCGWCRPYLHQMHEQYAAGQEAALTIDTEQYASDRDVYRQKKRDEKLAALEQKSEDAPDDA